MRIASLVPSATEALFALGAGGSVVGVTHECDYPPAACGLPHLTRTVIPEGLSAREIDAAVRERMGQAEALYELDVETLARLEPDLIVTQALGEVCAVSVDDVRAVADGLPGRPRVLSLDPTTLAEVLDDLAPLGAAIGAEATRDELVSDLSSRLEAVARAVEDASRPAVLALEWLDPPFSGGHWVPEMIAAAGGNPALGGAGERSRTVEWEELGGAGADVALVIPCGYDADGCLREALEHRDALRALGAPRVVAMDASAYFSRPGPRLVDGVELLAHALHPDRVGTPPRGARVVEVDLDARVPARTG